MADDLITGANPLEDPHFFAKERFAHYPNIEIKDMLDVDDPRPIWENVFEDSDDVVYHVFTIGGWLVQQGEEPKRLEWKDDKGGEHGHTVGGDVIVVTGAAHLAEALEMAREGLIDTIEKFVRELERQEALENARGSGIMLSSEIRGRH